MDKYIFTFEDGNHYISDTYTQGDIQSLMDGLLTIIRLSDGKTLVPTDESDPIFENCMWAELPKWNNL